MLSCVASAFETQFTNTLRLDGSPAELPESFLSCRVAVDPPVVVHAARASAVAPTVKAVAIFIECPSRLTERVQPDPISQLVNRNQGGRAFHFHQLRWIRASQRLRLGPIALERQRL